MIERGRGVGRREFLKLGALGAFGPALPGAATPARADAACILLWLQGGLSHLDSFDPKPDAPAEVRGAFGTIATAVPGLRLSEHLPRLARLQDRFAILRGLDPRNGAHGVAEARMLSGRPFVPGEVAPSLGSLAARSTVCGSGMPPYIQLGTALDPDFGGGRAGGLGEVFEPLVIPDDEPPARLPALDLSREDSRRLDRFGPHRLGRACLRAGRLVEAGTRFVTVTDGGWDTHRNGFRALGDRLLPRLDAALSALLEDLSDRGRLDSTLVVVLTDFGRTGLVNSEAGRDHAPRASVALLAGAGLRGGRAVGATGPTGDEPAGPSHGPEDVAATILDRLGIAADAVLPEGRPIADLAG